MFRLMDKKDIKDILALTPMQEGMLFHYLHNPGSDLYAEQLCLSISGEIDSHLFEAAWDFVIKTNDMLRAVFRWKNIKQPVQIILKEYNLKPAFYDFSNYGIKKKKQLIEETIIHDRRDKFDLQEVPFRVTLCKLSEDKYELIISHHHIIYDGWSSSIILKEFFETYEQLSHGQTPVSPKKGEFKEYIKGIHGQDRKSQEKFWKKYLKGFETRSEISGKRTVKEIGQIGSYQIRINKDMKDKLAGLVSKYRITLASLLYSCWGILLQKYNTNNDVIFDTTVSGRSEKISGMENTVGLFINTFPLRVTSQPEDDVSDLLLRTYQSLQQLENFENSSQVIIKECLNKCMIEKVFDSVLVIENYPLNMKLMQKNSKFSISSFSFHGAASYDITVIITVFKNIEINFTFNKDLFNAEIIEKLSQHFSSIIHEITADSRRRVDDITLFSEGKKHDILEYLNSKKRGVLKRVHDIHSIKGEFIAPRDESEEKLRKIWSEVLHINKENLSIDASFFDFGGHSLRANILVSKIHKEFNVKIPLAEVFEHSTIREISQYIKNAREYKYDPLKPHEEKEYYSLSSAQMRIYTLQQLDPASTAYNVSYAMTVEGKFEKKRFEESFGNLINRHESLRTTIEIIEGKPVQRIQKEVDFEVGYYDSNDEVIKPFGLSQAPLLRVGLKKIEDGRHILMLDMHHIITDAFSMDIFIKEFMAFYKRDKLPVVKHQYKDFSEWQNRRLRTGELKQHEEYWLEHLQGDLPVLNMLTDYKRPAVQSFAGERISIYLEKNLCRQLREFIREREATLFMVLLANLCILLNRYTGQEDLIIGTTVAGRNHWELEHIMGLFIETLAIRNFPRGSLTFAEFLHEVKQSTLSAFENEAYPFRELMKRVGDSTEMSRNPLFDVMLIVQNVDMTELDIEEIKLIPYELDLKRSKLDLTLDVFESGEEIRIDFEYCSRLFKKETVERLAGHFENILQEIIGNPEILLSEIVMMGKNEFRQILDDFKGTKEEFANDILENIQDARVGVWFEKEAAARPDNSALVYEDKILSYRELNHKANILSKIIEGL